MSFTLTIWDDDKVPKFSVENSIYWKIYNISNENIISIPSYLEQNADKFKKLYLAFINDLGQEIIESKSIIEHLKIDKDLSFWWLNLLSEKSPFKSPNIFTCLKLLAINEIILKNPPNIIVLYSNDHKLRKSINQIANNLNIEIKYFYIENSILNLNNFNIQCTFTYLIKAILSNLKYLIKRLPLKKLSKYDWINNEKSIFICSYFIHLNKKSCENGIFHSHHWEKLPELLLKNGFKINWIHHFLYSKIVPDTNTGLSWIYKFNKKNRGNEFHSFLDSYLTLPIVMKAYKRWFNLFLNSNRILHLEKKSTIIKSNIFLWAYLKDDWLKSLIGPIAIRNCLWLEIFDNIFKEIPHQKIGLYLYENQDWEFAMLHSWYKYGHGKIFGVQHSTVPFWHLYYFDNIKTINNNGHLIRPTPYQIAVNGKHSWDAFLNQGYNLNKLIKVEALRYLYLNEVKKAYINIKKSIFIKKKVLIIGDLNPASLHRFLTLINETLPSLLSSFDFTFKPHPGLAVDLKNYPNILISETTEPLVNLLKDFHIAISSNSTSASLETFLVGIKTIIYKDVNELDLSPMRDQSNVFYITNSKELLFELYKIDDTISCTHKDNDFLFLDQDMKKWKQLINTFLT